MLDPEQDVMTLAPIPVATANDTVTKVAARNRHGRASVSPRNASAVQQLFFCPACEHSWAILPGKIRP